MVYKADEREEYCLSGRGLDDCRFANSSGVEVDVGAFFCGLLFDVQV